MVLSFMMLDDQLVLHGPMGAFPVDSAWETTEAAHCGGASLWPVSGLVFFGAATALAHGDDLCEGAPWPSLACLSRDPQCITRPRLGLAPKRRPTPAYSCHNGENENFPIMTTETAPVMPVALTVFVHSRY